MNFQKILVPIAGVAVVLLAYRSYGWAGVAAAAPAEAEGSVEFLTAPSMSIRGGTDEIQRNIVGERVLGLPPEPRVDRDLPWSRSRV